MPILIRNAAVILPKRILKNASLVIDGAKIASVGPGRPFARGARVIDARGSFIAPGFIDTHIHGSPEKIFRNELKGGTTSIVVALSCASLPELYRQVDGIRGYDGPGRVLGVRIEGPYLNARKCGAQDPAYIRRPDRRELEAIIRRCGRLLKMMTVAPEMPNALSLVKLLKRRGVIASFGHSDATRAETSAGIDAGITHVTHLFNAMRGPDAAAALLPAPRVTAEIIADMVHVHPARFVIACAAKGIDRMVLVTDSIAAERPKGAWKEGGVYWLRKGVKAGSCLTMIDALKNAVLSGGVPLVDAVRMATGNPARLMGAGRAKGSIAAGKDADLVVFDRDFRVQMTFVRGKIAYQKG